MEKMKAISPFIATILLVVITIAAGLAVYTFLSSYISPSAGTAATKKSLEECINAKFDVGGVSKATSQVNLTLLAKSPVAFDLGREFLVTLRLLDGSNRVIGYLNITETQNFGNCDGCVRIATLVINLPAGITVERVSSVSVESSKCPGVIATSAI